MKISERWLRERANPDVDTVALAEGLTLAGLELTHAPLLEILPTGVVVGHIAAIEPHPEADRLRICRVDTGDGELRQIVCGAANAAADMRVVAALPGAALPNGMAIKPTKLRGVESAGMLCSAAELGLAESSDGIMSLSAGAPLGVDIVEYLALDDQVLDFELTPNRGDCLSLRGLARECGAVFSADVTEPAVEPAAVTSDAAREVRVDDAQGCSQYAGRVVSGIDGAARTPDWMVERLRRGGIRVIHPVVDITNYVMLELGQPMHAFDCARLDGGITVRAAKSGESIELLNEQTVTLDDGELLIADDAKPLALAGVMGGEGSGVSGETTDIFLESARFAPEAVAGTGRRHKLHSDSLHRYERNVDPQLQELALERATELVLSICGGAAGPVVTAGPGAPAQLEVPLRHSRLERVLGIPVAADTAVEALERLGITCTSVDDGWACAVPSHRPDLCIEPDLIEEVARLIGYDRIVAEPYTAALSPAPQPEGLRDADRVRDAFAARGYTEAVTYSFVDAAVQNRLTPDVAAIALDNPIAETMGVMRTTLWSGLLPALRHNQQRQHKRVRLFEFGVCFDSGADGIIETPMLSGVAAGPVAPEQWGAEARAVDFFDIKGDLEALFGDELTVVASEHPALHPGQSAQLLCRGQAAGWIGALHPRLARELDLAGHPIVFELQWPVVAEVPVPRAAPVSEFPTSRRDLALLVPETVTADALVSAVHSAAPDALSAVRLFDLYRGEGLPTGFKSVALGLIFQGYSRTLKDDEVDGAVQAVIDRLADHLGASVRGE